MSPTSVSEAIERFKRVNDLFPQTEELSRFKAAGGKIFGWLCSYVPEELLHAAEILPIRVTGCQRETEPTDGNAYLSMVSCSFSRSCLQMGLEGKYAGLDGFLAGSTCDGARRLYDHWRRYINPSFSHILSVPRKNTPSTVDLYSYEIQVLKEKIEDYSGKAITDESLLNSIDIYNQSRTLLSRLYEFRKRDSPPVNGAQALEVLNAASRLPKEIFNSWLTGFLDDLEKSPVGYRGQARVMIVGSALNNPAFLESIEKAGALVVADDLCTGHGYFSGLVEVNKKERPLAAISRRYLSNLSCARMFPSRERFDRIAGLAGEYRVEGIISENVRYCVPHAHDLPLLTERMKEVNIPVLALDIEYGTAGSGQIQTRVQAFLEMIASNRRQKRGRG